MIAGSIDAGPWPLQAVMIEMAAAHAVMGNATGFFMVPLLQILQLHTDLAKSTVFQRQR
jgi:hypothetical protein